MKFAVTRTTRGSRFNTYKYEEQLPWGELTDREQHEIKRKVTLRTMIATGGLALVASLWTLSGDYGTSLPKDEAGKKMREEVAEKYLNMSAREKFEATYIDPIEYNADYIQGESGIQGQLHHMLNTAYDYKFGQACLAPTSFNTRRAGARDESDGGVDGVATLESVNGNILVYPGDSEASPLVFEVRRGELFPDAPTRDTLLANNCRVADGLVVQRGAEEEGRLSSDSFNHRLHPSQF